MLLNKYIKCKSPINWENYRLQRNRVTKFKKKNSKKGTDGSSEIRFSENAKNISDQERVCEVFNNFFVNVAKDIGSSNNTPNDLSTHPSVIKITENIPEDTPDFSFKGVLKEDVRKIMSKFDIKKPQVWMASQKIIEIPSRPHFWTSRYAY